MHKVSTSNSQLAAIPQSIEDQKHKLIGDQIKAITAEQINEIAKKMQQVLAAGLPLSEMAESRQLSLDENHKIVHTSQNLRETFISHTPFAQDMRKNFAYGSSFLNANGLLFSYSYGDILKYGMDQPGGALPLISGKVLNGHKDYRIALELDLEKTNDKTLSFNITEKNGAVELSKVSFDLSAL